MDGNDAHNTSKKYCRYDTQGLFKVRWCVESEEGGAWLDGEQAVHRRDRRPDEVMVEEVMLKPMAALLKVAMTCVSWPERGKGVVPITVTSST